MAVAWTGDASPRNGLCPSVHAMTSLWLRCAEKIQEEVSAKTFDRWFAGLRETDANESSLTLQAPNSFTAGTLRSRYWGILTDILKQEAGPGVSLILSSNNEENGAPAPAAAEEAPPESRRAPACPDFLNPKYHFGNFVVGASNEFAHACATRVADGMGATLNPLFIYGGVGLGKTHLLHAIAHRILDRRPEARVLYTSAENFINSLIASLRRNRMAAFRSKYRKVDALMIDDIQFIAGKERTQEEFFFTFNALHDGRKQIIITSDKMPKDTPGLEERLQARFVWGMMADIGAPDFETKVAILQKKAGEQGFSLSRKVAHYIAEKVRSNIRELEGCLIKLNFHASLHDIEIDLPVAQEVLRGIIRDPARNSTVDNIQRIVAAHFQIRVADIKSKNRSRCFAIPRQIAMYLSRKLTRASTTDIGRRFGGKDHSTVIHSTNKIEELIKTDQATSNAIQVIRQKIELS